MSVIATRPTLYERLPELYRQRDEALSPQYPLRAFVDAIDSVMQALAAQVGAQYDDLFIETCDDWVVAYLADLVGTSHLKGDPWTLRADVARTVKHRRRKGTLGAVESQVHALSGWAVHATLLRERMAWNQPLNHLRPDVGGGPPFGRAPYNQMTRPIRGGTATLRSPGCLSSARRSIRSPTSLTSSRRCSSSTRRSEGSPPTCRTWASSSGASPTSRHR